MHSRESKCIQKYIKSIYQKQKHNGRNRIHINKNNQRNERRIRQTKKPNTIRKQQQHRRIPKLPTTTKQKKKMIDYFKTQEEEAKHYGINGCTCIECGLARFHLTWEQIIENRDTTELNEMLKKAKQTILLSDIASRRYGFEIKQGMILCPFHEDKSPSMKLYDKTASYHCFGCGANGDLINFIDAMEKYKTRKIGSTRAIITPETRYIILSRQKWSCNRCGKKISYSKKNTYGEQVAHIDHIHPYSKRNTYINGADKINEYANLQALCEECNLRKHNATR